MIHNTETNASQLDPNKRFNPSERLFPPDGSQSLARELLKGNLLRRTAEELSEGNLFRQGASQPLSDAFRFWFIPEKQEKRPPPSHRGSASSAPLPGFEQISVFFDDPKNPTAPVYAKSGCGMWITASLHKCMQSVVMEYGL